MAYAAVYLIRLVWLVGLWPLRQALRLGWSLIRFVVGAGVLVGFGLLVWSVVR